MVGDPRVPSSGKRWLWFAVAWFLSPLDLILEFIPVVGPLDDAIVAALVLRHPPSNGSNVLADHWRGDTATLGAVIRLGQRKPSKQAHVVQCVNG